MSSFDEGYAKGYQDGLAAAQAALNTLAEQHPLLPRNAPIEDLKLTARPYNILRRAEISTIADLVTRTEEDLLKMQHFDTKCLEAVVTALRQYGYALNKA